EEKMMSVMLKQGYAPEEQYRKNGDQGPWTDVYGMCATMYKCITGVVPEDALDRLHEDTLKKPSQLGVSIAQPLELTLMYGLAVNKNNRCKDMAELLELTQRALADNLETTAFNSPATDVYKTQAADDDMYKTQAAENAYPVNAPVVPDSTYANQLNGVPMYNPAPKKKNNALVALIIATIAFLVIAVVVLFAVLLSDDSSDYVYTPIHSDSSQVVETEEPTEKPTEKETEAKKVEVPDVEGMYYEDAKSKLKSAGLKVKEEWQDSSSVEYGYVISQTPSAYKTAEKDDKVKIYVSQTYQYDDVYYSAASDDLTLREAPARGAKKITSIGYNHRIGVLDYACTSEYSYVEYRGYKGYVMTYYLSKSPNPTPDPSPEPPSPNSELNNVNLTTYYCRASDHANLREKPSSKSKSLDTIPCRGMVVGIDPGGDFYLVEYNGKVGYVLKEVFSTDPDAPLSYID
ncbi:MAG: PASTA domain-containing protein, partial [Ruminococcus sp.]|nr:PASTA domain-containing protein [Ruminococcus sp.]